MEKPTFYCDCDGVILNTIEVAFQIMRENGCNMHNRNEVDDYFRRLIDWNEIFDKAEIINNSIDRLRYLKDSNIFKDVVILTKLSGADHEERLKRDLFKELLPDIRVVTLQYGLSKGVVVHAEGNILLDDEIGNCQKWRNEAGTAVLFSQHMCNPQEDIISDLNELTNANGVKKLLKTRYF